MRGKGLVVRTTAPHFLLGTKGPPGEPRTACSFPANMTGTSWQLPLGELCYEPPGLATPDKATQCGGSQERLWPQGSSSWSAATRPLSFRYIRTRRSGCSACRTSQQGQGATDGLLRTGQASRRAGDKGHVVAPCCSNPWTGILGLGVPSGTRLAWERLAQGTVGLRAAPLPQAHYRAGAQRTVGAMRTEGRGQARACMLKDPSFLRRAAREDKTLLSGHAATVGQTVHPLEPQRGEDEGRPVMAG